MHAAAEALKAAAAQVQETEVQELWPAAGQITWQIRRSGSALAETTAYKFRGLGWEVAATVSVCRMVREVLPLTPPIEILEPLLPCFTAREYLIGLL